MERWAIIAGALLAGAAIVGYAYHEISDKASPSHAGKEWPGLKESILSADAVTHVWHETQFVWRKWPEEKKTELTDQLDDRLMEALNQVVAGYQGWNK